MNNHFENPDLFPTPPEDWEETAAKQIGDYLFKQSAFWLDDHEQKELARIVRAAREGKG